MIVSALDMFKGRFTKKSTEQVNVSAFRTVANE